MPVVEDGVRNIDQYDQLGVSTHLITRSKDIYIPVRHCQVGTDFPVQHFPVNGDFPGRNGHFSVILQPSREIVQYTIATAGFPVQIISLYGQSSIK